MAICNLKLFLASITFMLLAQLSFATTPVTGTLKNVDGSVPKAMFVRMSLRGCSTTQPRFNGVALIPPANGSSSYYADFAPDGNGLISGTVYSTRDAAGTGNGEIQCGDSYQAVWYAVAVWRNGAPGPEVAVHAKNGVTLDLTNATPITTTSVVAAPTGDSTYCRLDGGNCGFTGPVTTKSVTLGSFRGPNPWIDVTDSLYGAKGDGATDDSTAIATALTACTQGRTVFLPPTSSNTYLISSSLSVPTGCNFKGSGGGPGESSTTMLGTTLKWNGATSTAMLKYHDVSHASLDGINLDCNNISGCINLLYDSDNSPPSSLNTFRNITFKGAHQWFVVGLPGNTPTLSSACLSNSNQAGCYQADSFTLDNFNGYGNASDLTSEAIHINTANGAQSSVISQFNIQQVNVGIHVVQTNGSCTITRGNGIGSQIGSNSTFIQYDLNAIPCDLSYVESEGTQTYALHDSSCNPTAGFANYTMIAAYWFGTGGQVLIDGCSQILDLNHQANITMTVGGTASVMYTTALGTLWTTSGSGRADFWKGGVFQAYSTIQTSHVSAGDIQTSASQNLGPGTQDGHATIVGFAKVGASLVLGSTACNSGIIGFWMCNPGMFTSPGTSDLALDISTALPSQATTEFDALAFGNTGAASTTHALIHDIKINGTLAGSGGAITTENMVTCGVAGSASTTRCLNNSGGTIVLTPNVRSGASGNTDIAGILTASGSAASYTFTQSYASHPICTATDETTVTSAIKVAYTGTTAVTFTTPGVTDVIDYVCVGRN